MTTALAALAAYAVATAACLYASLRQSRGDLAAERLRVADLLTRLASRTPAEYQAVANMQHPGFAVEPVSRIYDPTGLIGIDYEDDLADA